MALLLSRIGGAWSAHCEKIENLNTHKISSLSDIFHAVLSYEHPNHDAIAGIDALPYIPGAIRILGYRSNSRFFRWFDSEMHPVALKVPQEKLDFCIRAGRLRWAR